MWERYFRIIFHCTGEHDNLRNKKSLRPSLVIEKSVMSTSCKWSIDNSRIKIKLYRNVWMRAPFSLSACHLQQYKRSNTLSIYTIYEHIYAVRFEILRHMNEIHCCLSTGYHLFIWNACDCLELFETVQFVFEKLEHSISMEWLYSGNFSMLLQRCGCEFNLKMFKHKCAWGCCCC